MFTTFGEMTPLFWGTVGAAVFFAIQLLLCFEVKETTVKCIPAGLIVLGFLLSGMIYAGSFGSYSAGAISGNGIVGLLLAVITGIAAAGVLAAWLLYGVLRFIRVKK